MAPFWVLLEEGYRENLRDRDYNCITITYSNMVWNINKQLKRYTNTENRELSSCQLRPLQDVVAMTTCSATSYDKAGPMTTLGFVWRKFLKSGFTQVTPCRYHTTNLKHKFIWYKHCKLSRPYTTRYQIKSKGEKSSSGQTVWGVFLGLFLFFLEKGCREISVVHCK